MFGFRKKPEKVPNYLKNSQFLIAPSPARPLDLNDQAKIGTNSGDNLPIIVSYGTRDGKFDRFADRLRDSCTSTGHDHSIETIPACSRANACLFKPTFIKFKLITLGRTIMWLDADAILTEKIAIADGDWDVGTLSNNRDNEVNEKASLCIAFRPTVAALRFIELWEQFCSAHWLVPGLDHRRYNYARFAMGEMFSELDITELVEGKLIRDAGTWKEAEL